MQKLPNTLFHDGVTTQSIANRAQSDDIHNPQFDHVTWKWLPLATGRRRNSPLVSVFL